jgi:hypothetical protein
MGYSNQSLFCVGVNMFKAKWPIENSITNCIVGHWDTICEEILKMSRVCSVSTVAIKKLIRLAI